MQSNTTAIAHAGIASRPSVRPSARPVGRREARVAAAMAALFGVMLIWGVGFSHIQAFHNAAHDTRHSNAFPCH